MKVYLAGGFHSNWQQTLIERFSEITFINPAQHGLTEAEEYTAWDIDGVKECDILFAYLEQTNPSGLGMAFEMGCAVAEDKYVIFVNEKHPDRYTEILECAADVVVTSLRSGIGYLDWIFQYMNTDDTDKGENDGK